MSLYLQMKDELMVPCKIRLQLQNSLFRKIRYSVNLVQKLFIARLKVSFINVQERNSLFGSQDSRLNQNFGNLFAVVCFPLQVRPLFFVKDVGHSINLVQKCFIGVPLQRYIFSELLVKKTLQLFGGNIFFFKDIAKNTEHFGAIGCITTLRGSAVVNGEELFNFDKIDVKLFVEHTAVAHELSVVQVGVPFQGKLILGEQRKHVDVRQVVILRLLDGARNDTGRVVDKPIDKKRIEVLLHLNKDRVARLGSAVDIENGGLVIQNTGVFRNTQGERLDGVFTGEQEHRIQKLHGAFGLGLVRYEHFEDAITEWVNILVDLAVFGQSFGVLMNILHHGEKVTAVHKPVPSIGLKGKSKNNNFHSCKQLFAKCCKKKFVKASGSIYEMPLAA